MTPRETAEEIWYGGDVYIGDGADSDDAKRAIAAIEQAITAAVEEEREACAKIAEDSYDSFTDTTLPFAGPALLKAAKDIRARNNGGTK